MFYGEFMSPAKIKCVSVLMYSARYLCPILTKSGVSRQILTKAPIIKLNENTSSGRRADRDGETGKTELTGAFRDYANGSKDCKYKE
jgi:hypothetical protein